MNDWAGPLTLAAAGTSGAVTVCLLSYLDLRIHALKQSGELPSSTPQLLGFSWFGTFPRDLMTLYSRSYREIDRHTQALVPILRISLPLTPLLLLIAALLPA